MSANLGNLELILSSKIDKNSSAEDILLITSYIEKLKTGTIFTVQNFSLLPDINTMKGGELYFCENEKTLYVAEKSFNLWIPIVQDYIGQIWSWGYGGQGRLGDNTATDKSSPVSVVGGFTDWCQVSAGDIMSAAVRTNGTLWTWGVNGQGQLGDGTTTNRSSPVSVIGGFSGWCQVSAGRCHTAAVRTNGTIWAWGGNDAGVLGVGDTSRKSSPVSVVGGITDWCQINAGFNAFGAVRPNCTAWMWGYENFGSLGNNETGYKNSPVQVAGGFTDWSKVSTGACFTAALRSNGTLWTWGSTWVGELGDNNIIIRSSPVSVVGGFTDWCQISAGCYQSAAIRGTGTLWTWGENSSGQLGDGTTVNRSSPVTVVGGFTDWCKISIGSERTTGIRTNDTVWTWGDNVSCRLGDGTNINRSSPVQVLTGNLSGFWDVNNRSDNTFLITRNFIKGF